MPALIIYNNLVLIKHAALKDNIASITLFTPSKANPLLKFSILFSASGYG